jgi:hypothetical protein
MNARTPEEIDFFRRHSWQVLSTECQAESASVPGCRWQAHLAALAARKGVALSELANELLKKDIAILETGK